MDIVIIEDEDLAANSLEKMLLKMEYPITIKKRLESVEQSIEWFKNNTCDLILSDIHLGDGESFEIFDSLKIKTPIIFTTAFDQYAIQSFQFFAIDYLLKPYDTVRLENAIKKHINFNKNTAVDFKQLDKYILELKDSNEKKEEQKRFLVSIGENFRSIESNQIAYFMAENKSLFIFTISGESYLYADTISSLEHKLSKDQFFKINRKYIISHLAIKKIAKYSHNRLKIELQPQINARDLIFVSSNRITAFKDWLNR
ncbi:two component transcriptional regulator, LytTR family [Polaribacter sp. KT25b]|uniref:LytR/AlgR family response regulator transcription factor n=1 Tax=Polaribacter sp. KT25b TaxID=1855336 RepID=UPI00087B020E|nr:LytTR family DNA-binding domain-containing protein [Polaribacter sp. KT25b]SDS48931.1 two component transcriptional regulator, LytTR family [Polaribacter sp. KT25b]